MRVLVTGGAGYIGSVVAELLLAAGHDAKSAAVDTIEWLGSPASRMSSS